MISASHTDAPGALFRLLEPFAKAGISLTRIESRPSRRKKWDYVFFVDLDGHAEQEPLASALADAQDQGVALQGRGLVPEGDSLTMGSYRVAPAERIAGEVTIPGDKSISHRAVMFGAIASGTTRIRGFLEGEDCLATMRAVRQLGVEVERPGAGEVVVRGVGLRGLKAPAGDARHG